MVWKLFLWSSLRKSYSICPENSDLAKLWPFKAIGGYRGKNTCLCYMKELFNTKSALLTECQNSISSSRYSRLSIAGYGGNQTFSNINLYYKNIAKNGPNNNFLEPKMVLDFILMVFHVSLWFA